MASSSNCFLSIGTTPIFSQTNPPAKFASVAVSTGESFNARHIAAILTTVSPAPETSDMLRIWAGISAFDLLLCM